jgi:hypothetical protein
MAGSAASAMPGWWPAVTPCKQRALPDWLLSFRLHSARLA